MLITRHQAEELARVISSIENDYDEIEIKEDPDCRLIVVINYSQKKVVIEDE